MHGDPNLTQIGPEEAAEIVAVKADPTVKSKFVTSSAAADGALENWRANLPGSPVRHEPAENC